VVVDSAAATNPRRGPVVGPESQRIAAASVRHRQELVGQNRTKWRTSDEYPILSRAMPSAMQSASPVASADATVHDGYVRSRGLFYVLLLLDCLAFWCVLILGLVLLF
jgi:hypothetical protein